MADQIRKGYSRTNYIKAYNELFDMYLPLIGKGDGLAYYSYLKRYVNNDNENDYNGYAFPGTRKIKNDIGYGQDKIKEIQLKCIAWGLLNVLKQDYKNNLYEVNDPFPKYEFLQKVYDGQLPRNIIELCPELLPTDKKSLDKIISNISETATLLKSSTVYLDRYSPSVPNEVQGECTQRGTEVYPNRNTTVPNEVPKKKNINNSFDDEEDSFDFARYIVNQSNKNKLNSDDIDILITNFTEARNRKIKQDGDCINPIGLFNIVLKNYIAEKQVHSAYEKLTTMSIFDAETSKTQEEKAREEYYKNIT